MFRRRSLRALQLDFRALQLDFRGKQDYQPPNHAQLGPCFQLII